MTSCIYINLPGGIRDKRRMWGHDTHSPHRDKLSIPLEFLSNLSSSCFVTA